MKTLIIKSLKEKFAFGIKQGHTPGIELEIQEDVFLHIDFDHVKEYHHVEGEWYGAAPMTTITKSTIDNLNATLWVNDEKVEVTENQYVIIKDTLNELAI